MMTLDAMDDSYLEAVGRFSDASDFFACEVKELASGVAISVKISARAGAGVVRKSFTLSEREGIYSLTFENRDNSIEMAQYTMMTRDQALHCAVDLVADLYC